MWNLVRLALTIGAATLVAGCGAQNGPSALPPSIAAQSKAHRASGYSGDLLYVAEESDSVNVLIFTYPQGQLYATVSNLYPAWGICSDTAGNVYVDAGLIYEFAHGSTVPTRTIQMPAPAFATSCSVDATTGNLASIDIWPNAQGTPTTYAAPFKPWTIAYDNRGNLWVDGTASDETVLLAELPNGSSQFKTITLDKPTHWAGSVQWDGKYVAVLTNDKDARIGHHQLIYRLRIKGQKGTVVAKTPLRQIEPGGFFLVQGAALIGTLRGGDVGFWHYPTGGAEYKELTAGGAWGSAISVAPSRSRH